MVVNPFSPDATWDFSQEVSPPSSRGRRPTSGKFLGASPIKVAWINAAARLGLQPLRVGLALQYLRCMRKRATVLFSQITANAFEIDAKNKYRGTKALEKAGLIHVVKSRRGSSPHITIIEVGEPTNK